MFRRADEIMIPNSKVKSWFGIAGNLTKREIIWIRSVSGGIDKRIIAIDNNCNLYKSQDEIGPSKETLLQWDKKEIQLYPFKSPFSEGDNSQRISDLKCMFALIEQGKYLISCCHFDNKIRVTSTENWETVFQLSFHQVRKNTY